jgi:hypothetical protein
MLYYDIIAVYYGNHINPINTLSGQCAGSPDVTELNPYTRSYHWVLQTYEERVIYDPVHYSISPAKNTAYDGVQCSVGYLFIYLFIY